MKKFIVITSIFKPTEAVKRFSKLKDWHLIVVGDKKTPSDWKLANTSYLSPETQKRLGYSIINQLPWNHYCRKMVGYLYAISLGADIIADTDDDNIPLKKWGVIPDEKEYTTISSSDYINIYSLFTDKFVWPRGFPLNKILNPGKFKERVAKSKIAVWQGLANGDPDVDAIYRLTLNKPVNFKQRDPVVLDKYTFSQLNSQNTIFTKAAFPLLFLPAFVTFRFTDILRGFVIQPILWNSGFRVGFTSATVIQKRNPHDYMKDFESELPVYLTSSQSMRSLKSSIIKKAPIEKNLIEAYNQLEKLGIVQKNEILLLKSWLKDITTLQKKIKRAVL